MYVLEVICSLKIFLVGFKIAENLIKLIESYYEIRFSFSDYRRNRRNVYAWMYSI